MEHSSEKDLHDKPALKLLPFFHGLASGEAMTAEISVDSSKAASTTMASLGAIDGDLIKTWIRQWGF
jgi:hypothetical protein